ncbi:hypothetical protein BD289DRAFT_349979, partial [Coniella lustricola]
MGRLGPLTSMALGRSPYDDVVMGEGESDPREPLQMYDERGRPVNPETKRINKDIIRSHNEVMLVIGVVESENTIEELKAEQLRRYEHEHRDVHIARRLEGVARACEFFGVYGVTGMRQRILLYREYQHVPFSRLWQVERQTQSPTSLWLHGLPAYLASTYIEMPWISNRFRASAVARAGFTYLKISLELWGLLQQTQLLPSSASPWFPSWKFFVPFSSASVISPCPLPPSLGTRSILGWLSRIGLSVTPYIVSWLLHNLYVSAWFWLHKEIYAMLPSPSNHEPRSIDNLTLSHRLTAERESEPAQSQQVPPQDATERPIHAMPTEDRPRRSRATNNEDFSSDDEATDEVVSATLISFDVENHPENPDPAHDSNIPPGVWSAELRPNPGHDSAGSRDGDDGGGARRRASSRIYRVNELTRLPAVYAAEILARQLTSLIIWPLEAAALRELAWQWCQARGMSTRGLWEPAWAWPLRASNGLFGFRFDFFAGFSSGSFVNLIGLELVHLLFDATMWSLVSSYVAGSIVSDEQW